MIDCAYPAPPKSLDDELTHELVSRVYERRSLLGIAGFFERGLCGTLAAVPTLMQIPVKPPAGAVRVASNECWTAPFAAGPATALVAVSQGICYEPDGERRKLRDAVA